MGYRKGGKIRMKNRNLTLFGVPTLFTILISILIFSFATLSFLNTLNIRYSIDRGNQILEDSYTLQSEMDIELIGLNKMVNDDPSILNQENLQFNGDEDSIVLQKEYHNLSLFVKVKLVRLDRIEFNIIEWKLTAGNNQDYTQDGDPVFGG